MYFSHVTRTFENIERVSKRLEITHLLAQLFAEATPDEINIICNLALGQLHPPYVGTQFALAEKNMIKAIAALTGESEAHIHQEAKNVGDLGLLIGNKKWAKKGNATVSEVYQALCTLEETSGIGSQEDKSQQFVALCTQLDSLDAKYIVRIILGKLRLGFSDMTIIDALSWMEKGDKSLRSTIEHAYNIQVDIGSIAALLKEKGITQLDKIGIKIGIPIRPAAAERLPTAEAIIEKLGPCVAQPKLDGFRLQIHVNNKKPKPEIYFFSRHLQNMSDMFPDLEEAVAHIPVDTMICEGEAIVFDPDIGNFVPFQETVKRKRKHNITAIAQDLPIKIFIFDILYLNGESLLNKTHEERRALLVNVFKDYSTPLLQVLEELNINTATQLENYFFANIEKGLEGIVVKRSNAPYTPGKRNFNWIKLKRQESGELEDTLDCVVLGYYRGKGKRTHFGIGAFLVGIYNKNKDMFETIAKVGTGLKDNEWKEIKIQCDATACTLQPSNVDCPVALVPDVWVKPSLVVLIRADEITLSPLHTCGKTTNTLGYALRFPRFMGYRPDKEITEATEVKEVKRLFDDQYHQRT